ncbi:transcription factor bHLH155-like isoform X2 [Hibiscus syriacus]|uniref:transcription factor bHLH155-like isoform X2 n=1 Tax=Hibiscus syriacus TaxID=106335 RepID=UPI001921405E|nr:transcription factor bHLH155-like isoform X2 [Hibiscus syriacus]
MGSALKQTLKNLCCSNGWSYGVFWRFDHRNSMLLTMEDAYYEQKIGPLIDNMHLKFHILGEGIIGQAAFTGKHQWIFSDQFSSGNENIFQDESELQDQFSSGIKTIAVVSVGRWGVVQFGSPKKIFERLEFLTETEKLFHDMTSCHWRMPFEIETCNPDGLFASLTSGGRFCNENVTTEQGGACSREPTGWSRSFQNLTESFRFVHGVQNKNMNFDKNSRINCLAANTPCASPWDREDSILTLNETSYPTERGVWDPSIALPKMGNGLELGGNTEQNLQGGSAFTSFYSTGELVDADSHNLDKFGETEQKQHSFDTNTGLLDSVISLQRRTEDFNLADFTTDLSSSFTMDDLFQWFSPSPQQHIQEAGATMSDPSCSVGVISMPSIQIGGDAIIDNPVRQAANSSQSSVIDAFISNIEKSSTVHGNGKDLFSDIGMDFKFRKAGESSEDVIMPLLHGDNSAFTSGISSLTSELDVHSMTGKRKGLFSELGLEELLGCVSNSSYVTKSSVEDQFSTIKRRKTGSSSSNFHQGQLEGLTCSGGSMNLVQHSHTWDNSNNTIFKKEVHLKSQVGLWIDDSYSVNAVAATSKKPTRKRAKPGESTRPRPKDRQLIQDRIKELRGIIPHSGKLSIDHLLERTIKYLLFLQGVTKYADRIKQADEPKLIGQKNGKLQKHNTMNGDATWAFEVGAQSIPIVVKNLNPPGQILIEMLCEDQGFLLEIAEVIRGFPLNILKGVMELQEDKIWARFIVEADKHVERQGIIWSLLPLLQKKESSGIDSSATQPCGDMDGGVSLLNSYQQPFLLPTVSLAETLQ